MKRTFFATLLSAAAFARGRNDGSDRANAWTTSLIDEQDGSLTLHAWNDSSDGSWQVIGDIEVSFSGDFPAFQSYICFDVEGSEFWDCIGAYASNIDSEDFGVTVSDQYVDASGALIVEKDNFGKKEHAWTNSNVQSDNCSEDADGSRSCTVSMRFHRNFGTDDLDWDIQLDDTMTDKMFDVRGLLRLLNQAENSVKTIGSLKEGGKQTLLVSEVSEEEPSVDPTPDGGDNGEEGGAGNGSEEGGNGDGSEEGGDNGTGDNGSGGDTPTNGTPEPETNDQAMAKLTALGVGFLAITSTLF